MTVTNAFLKCEQLDVMTKRGEVEGRHAGESRNMSWILTWTVTGQQGCGKMVDRDNS